MHLELERVPATRPMIHLVAGAANIRWALSRLVRSYGFLARSVNPARRTLPVQSRPPADCVVVHVHSTGENCMDLALKVSKFYSGLPIVLICSDGFRGGEPLQLAPNLFGCQELDPVVLKKTIELAIASSR